MYPLVGKVQPWTSTKVLTNSVPSTTTRHILSTKPFQYSNLEGKILRALPKSVRIHPTPTESHRILLRS